MKNVCFINGSPKPQNSSSLYFLKQIDNLMNDKEYNKEYIDTKLQDEKRLNSYFEKLKKADLIIFAFPLYVFCLPGSLTKFLEKYYRYIKNTKDFNSNAKVYAVVNCGFPEPKNNTEAIRIIENFSDRLNLTWRFGVSIAMGEYIGVTKKIPVINKLNNNVLHAVKSIYQDIDNDSANKVDCIYVKPKIPKSLFFLIANINWKVRAIKNGMKIKDFYKKPYDKGIVISDK